MATKNTGVTLRVSAVNATGRVFKNIASSAVGVTKNIAKWGSVAAGVALGAFAATAKKLGTLSDVAQAAGTGTEELTKLGAALNMIGVSANTPEKLAVAFQRMTKSTGQVGVQGFYNVLEVISKLPSKQERATAALQTFGRAGLAFMPVIERVARTGEFALQDLVAAMPGISQEAADAGDAVADAMSVMWSGIKNTFAEGVGKIAKLIDSDFKGGVREAAMVGAAQLKYFSEVGFRYAGAFFKNFRQVAIDTFQWLSKILDNSMKMIGGLLVTAAENMATRTKGVLEDLGTGAAALMARLRGDKESEQRLLRMARLTSEARDKELQGNWNEYFKLMEQLDWKYEGVMANIDTSDLQAQRDAQIEAAKKAGKAYANAVANVGEFADVGAQSLVGGKKADTTNPEAVMGGSYKALTYALRQGYATGIQEVKNLLKKAVDGINGVKDATEDVADNLDFGTV